MRVNTPKKSLNHELLGTSVLFSTKRPILAYHPEMAKMSGAIDGGFD